MSQFVYKRIQRQLKPVLRGHLWDKEKVVFKDRWPHKRGSIHMKFSLTGQEKGDLLNRGDHMGMFDCTYKITMS